jgi:hypothetical protein
MVPSHPQPAEPGTTTAPMRPYLELLYLESRSALFRILMDEATADPIQEEHIERIRILIEDDDHLEDCRKRLVNQFPGRIARMFNLAGENDELYPLDKLRESVRAHVARRLASNRGDDLDDIDRQALEDLKASSKLQQQLAYLVNYTPGKWLLQQELPAIEASRRIRLKKDEPPQGKDEIPLHAGEECYCPGTDPYQWSRDHGRLRGLCFSGGGIRSATFNLGVLQGLAKRDLLRSFDYLSSVSGGGYIHQWLAAWVKREEKRAAAAGKTGLELVTQQLIPQPNPGCEAHSPEAIKWLRRYSNYLTPRVGAFSADFWVTISIWLRNTFLNQIILISGLLFAILIPHGFLLTRVVNSLPSPEDLATGASGAHYQFSWLHLAILLGAAVPYLLAVINMTAGLYAERHPDKYARLSNSELCWNVVVPFVISAVAISDFGLFFVIPGVARDTQTAILCGFSFVSLVVLNMALTVAGGALTVSLDSNHHDHSETPLEGEAVEAGTIALRFFGFLLAAIFSAAVCTLCIYGLRFVSIHYADIQRMITHRSALINVERLHWRAVVTFGPFLVIALSFIGVVLHCGLVGKNFADWALEWLGRTRAWMTIYSMAWTFWLAISLYGYDLLRWLAQAGYSWIKWPAVGTWVVATAGSVLAGKSSKSSGEGNGGADPLVMRIIAAVGPVVYILGLLLLLSWAATNGLLWIQGNHWAQLSDAHRFLVAGLVLLAPFATFVLFGWRVDVNQFSMHSYYRNRLARCYLGASNPARDPDPLTGFDPGDLRGMQVSRFQPLYGYSGPLPIFCATLNISVGEDLAWQERKAASFAFSPVLSGYYVPWTGDRYRGQLSYNGFVPTDRFATPGGVHISTAAAISGAAVSPDAGYHTSGPMAFLLTMFNVRLGWWMENPRRSRLAFAPSTSPADACLHSTPRFAPYQLVQELLGRIGDDRQFVYLTDGGHFDNMGLYELVRRRCYDIVICDAEEDRGPVFEGIGMAIRKCRIDFGVEIELDLNQLAIEASTGLSRVHWITGKVWYPETGTADPGRILYIKSSITGKEAADVYNYRLQHAPFPQDSTTDQWFTESQFESYRRLGQQVIDDCPYLHEFGIPASKPVPDEPVPA